MEKAGFVYRHAAKIDMFLDGPGAERGMLCTSFLLASVFDRKIYFPPLNLNIAEEHQAFRLLDLESLVRMKLTSFRLKDQVHLQDMIEVGLVDQSWVSKYPPELAARLQQILDTPDG